MSSSPTERPSVTVHKPIKIPRTPTEDDPRDFQWTTKSSLWDWLKRERQFNDQVRQLARAEGLTTLQKQEANRGRRPAPMYLGRAARRRMGRFVKVAV